MGFEGIPGISNELNSELMNKDKVQHIQERHQCLIAKGKETHCNQTERHGSISGICMMKLDHFVLQTLQKTVHVQSLLFQGLKQLKDLNWLLWRFLPYCR